MKHSLRTLRAFKAKDKPLTWLTCYDFSFASVLEQTDLDLILVGDSGGMVSLGYLDTVPVTMDEMISMASAVRRGAPNKFIVGDMPKGSYEVSNEVAVNNAMRFMKESGCDAVKLEGGVRVAERILAITSSGIPVIGHLGLTPQSSSSLGGYRVIGRSDSEIEDLLFSMKSVQESGAFAVLLEAVPPKLALKASKASSLITFGIGAGPSVDGQLLILHDLLGLFPTFRPKFAKCFIPQALVRYSSEKVHEVNLKNSDSSFKPIDGLWEISRIAIDIYIEETRNRVFPGDKFSYKD
jgi:3-methyl-2-oxobutanoate hydroxymethyltransferase